MPLWGCKRAAINATASSRGKSWGIDEVTIATC